MGGIFHTAERGDGDVGALDRSAVDARSFHPYFHLHCSAAYCFMSANTFCLYHSIYSALPQFPLLHDHLQVVVTN